MVNWVPGCYESCVSAEGMEFWTKLGMPGGPTSKNDSHFYYLTRELPGVALVNILTWPIFMGKGNTLFCEICITLPGRVRRIERHRLSGYQSLGLRKHLDEPQTKDSHIS